MASRAVMTGSVRSISLARSGMKSVVQVGDPSVGKHVGAEVAVVDLDSVVTLPQVDVGYPVVLARVPVGDPGILEIFLGVGRGLAGGANVLEGDIEGDRPWRARSERAESFPSILRGREFGR